MCKLTAYDPRRPDKTRTYIIPEEKVETLKKSLSLAGYLVR